jgi:hypothetical protein
MDLLSPGYLLFVLAAAFLFQVCPLRWREALLSVISIGFFAMFSVISAAAMVGFTLLTFVVALIIERRRNTPVSCLLLWGNIAAQMSYLAFFKALPLLGLHSGTPAIVRFLEGFGASYYTFKLLSYLIDVYWGRQTVVARFDQLLAVISFFPQLPAGPIQRVSEWRLPDHRETYAELMPFGFRRIMLAFFKKILIADSMGSMISLIMGNQHLYHNQLWIAFYLFPLQLYADFSALTDLAVGIAALFGIRSPENFHLPFFAATISEFWRGWHMTLTRWLTDYVFTPLRMATRQWGNLGLILSLTINMTLIGLWHGFNLGFLCFGMVHAVFLIVDVLSRSVRERFYDARRGCERASRVYGPILTFHLVAFSLVFFQHPALSTSVYFLQHSLDGLAHPAAGLSALMYSFGRQRSLLAFIGFVLLVALEIAGFLRETSAKWSPRVPRFTDLPRAARWACYYAMIVTIILIHRQSTQFIYVQF